MKRYLLALLAVIFVIAVMAPGVFAKKYKLIMTNEVATTHWKTTLMKELATTIEKRSNGQIKVKLYPAAQLFTDKAAIKALGTGSVQMVWPVSVNVEPLRLEYGIINLPFAISDKLILGTPQYRKDLLNLLSKTLKGKGIRVMGLLRADQLVFVFKDKHPKIVDDLKGLKIRVIGGQVFLHWVKQLGATPISMPASEFTTALSQGVIDGIHTSSDGWAKMIGPLGKYGLLVPQMCVVTYSILVDDSWFNQLPKNLQEVVTSSVDELASRQWQYSIDKSKEAYDKIKNEFKAEVYVVPEDQIPLWAKKVQPTYKWFSEQFPEIYQKFVDLNKKYGRVWPPSFTK